MRLALIMEILHLASYVLRHLTGLNTPAKFQNFCSLFRVFQGICVFYDFSKIIWIEALRNRIRVILNLLYRMIFDSPSRRLKADKSRTDGLENRTYRRRPWKIGEAHKM